MINLEQIRLLESRVQKAVDRIENLTTENSSLKQRLESYKDRIDELEVLIGKFKDDQGKIEQGILNALAQLNRLESDVSFVQERNSREEQQEPVLFVPASLSPAPEHPSPAILADEPESGELSSVEDEAELDEEDEESDEAFSETKREAELDIF